MPYQLKKVPYLELCQWLLYVYVSYWLSFQFSSDVAHTTCTYLFFLFRNQIEKKKKLSHLPKQAVVI